MTAAVIALETLRRTAAERRAEFASAEPFPHVVIDDFLDAATAAAIAAEFDVVDDGWIYYHHVNERKRGFNDAARMGPASRAAVAALNAPGFLDALRLLTAIDGLVADPDLDGGGLHEMHAGGFVNVHTDFLSHTIRRSWARRVNVLVFLNRDWPAAYGGDLELWSPGAERCVRRIAPLFNRAVVFATTERALHGVPTPLACPADRARRSLALYYFTDEHRTRALRPTRYVPRPSDPPGRRALIHADRWLLHAYAVLKRYTPLGDRIATRLLRRL